MLTKFRNIVLQHKYILIILLLHCIVTLPFIETFPPVDNMGDESWMMNRSYTLLTTGKAVAPMHVGTPISTNISITTPMGYHAILASMIAMVGNNILAGRLLSFFISLMLLIVVYKFTCNLSDELTAIAASLLLGFNIMYSWHSREARPEMMFVLITMLSIYFLYKAKVTTKKRRIFLFLSGLSATLSVLAHPNGVMFCVAVLVIFFIYFIKDNSVLSTLNLIAGMVTGSVIWIVNNLIMSADIAAFSTTQYRYLPPFLKLSLEELFVQKIIGIWIKPPWTISMILDKYHSHIWQGLLYIILTLILMSILLSKRHRSKQLYLLSFVIIPYVAGSVLTGAWNCMHYFVFSPIIAIALSLSITTLTELLPRYKKTVRMLLVIGLVGYLSSDIYVNNVSYRKYSLSRLQDEIRAAIPEDKTLMGTSLYYFAFPDAPERFMSFLFLENRCPDFGTAIKMYKPDYIMVDSVFNYLSWMRCAKYSDRNDYYEGSVKKFLDSDAKYIKTIKISYPNEFAHKRIISKAYLYKVK
jgi:4-amino-4-deoxy-L-arabinose transferase-like glycosyltransferase